MVGAIRWDVWLGDSARNSKDIIESMKPEKYHYRLPWYADISNGNFTIDSGSQEIMDKQIQFAKQAGIDYFAFDYYPERPGDNDLSVSRSLYQSSKYKNAVNWCALLCYFYNFEEDVPKLIEQFKEENYQKVLNGRPLLYFFYVTREHLNFITKLRELTAQAGVPDPYIVALSTSASAVADLKELKMDAFSQYFTYGENGIAYKDYAANESKGWERYKETGTQVIPWVSTSWDKRPMADHVPSWETSNPASPHMYSEQGTPEQIAEQLGKAIDWCETNKETTVANAILIYAWNEFAEGGWIEPTYEELRDNGRPLRLDAIREMLKGVRANFSDINSVPWAENEIKDLAVSNVFDGIAKDEFEPSKEATRAEFISWLVRTLGLYSDSKDNFSDIKADAFYADELAIAKGLTITAGVGDNKFNPDSNISRQDLATLLARALTNLNVIDSNQTIDKNELLKFKDSGLVAQYAADSMALLVNEGILKGADGNVNPLGNVTRAEAAVICKRIQNKAFNLPAKPLFVQ